MAKLRYLALLGVIFGCSISDKDRCSEGRTWVAEYRGCVDAVAQAGSASGGEGAQGGEPSTTTTPATAGGDSSRGGDSGGPVGGSSAGVATSAPAPAQNLGSPCTDDTDCEGGVATFCLLNQQAPKDPGICTITNCNSAACGSAFDCCDCTKSPVLSSSWTQTRCIPSSAVSSLTPLSCTCS